MAPGKIIFTPIPLNHSCEGKPFRVEDLTPGTIWECDECHLQWVVVSGQGEDGKGYSAWRHLTEHNRSGNDY